MHRLTVEIDEMSVSEAKAWYHALMDKYGSDLAMECLKEREHRFEVKGECLQRIGPGFDVADNEGAP